MKLLIILFLRFGQRWISIIILSLSDSCTFVQLIFLLILQILIIWRVSFYSTIWYFNLEDFFHKLIKGAYMKDFSIDQEDIRLKLLSQYVSLMAF